MNRLKVIGIACILGMAHATASSEGDELPRRGALGVALQADESGAISIASVHAASAAAEAGLRAGDIIEALNGERPASTAEVIAAIGKHHGGDSIAFDLRREGRKQRVVVVLKPLPHERMQNAIVEYGHVTIGDRHRLRTILSVPNGGSNDGPVPGVLFLQGGSCASIDVPWVTTAGPNAIVHAIGSRGFATMRVEKPGVGDSEGPPCETIGYRQELEGYQAALRALTSNPRVDSKRVFLLGVSLGGFFAPIVAREAPIAGIAVYGTLAAPPPPYPGRSDLFFREIAGVDILATWAAVDSPVLSLHGEYDERTSRSDHETIVRVVNERRAGFAEHRELAELDHCGTRHASFQAAEGKCGGGEMTSDLAETVLAFFEAHS